MPEETENYIRIPVSSGHGGHRIRTISLSADQGISALYCGECKEIITYLFAKDHDWTMEKAEKWVKEHKKSGEKGGAGSGWYGPPKGDHVGQGGEALGFVPQHVWKRAGQRSGFSAVKKAIKRLRKSKALPGSKKKFWHLELKKGGERVGFLVGRDAKAQTVLGPGMTPRKDSMPVAVSAAGKATEDEDELVVLNLEDSVHELLGEWTDAQRETWCKLNEYDEEEWETQLRLSVDEHGEEVLASIIEAFVESFAQEENAEGKSMNEEDLSLESNAASEEVKTDSSGTTGVVELNVEVAVVDPESTEDSDTVKAEDDRAKLEAAQKNRASASGIAPKEGGNLTRPSRYEDCPDNNASWGDWTNYRYPLVPEERGLNGVVRFNDKSNKAAGGYDDDEWGKIGRRIAAKNGEGYNYDADKEQISSPSTSEKKATDAKEALDDTVMRVRDAFSAQASREAPAVAEERFAWVRKVFEDHVIVETPEGLFKYPWSEGEGGKIQFGEPVAVEEEYAEKMGLKATTLSAVKAHPSGEWGRVCGWGAPFGGPFNGKDLDGEFFTARTDFALGWYPEGRPILYHHGKDKGAGILPVGREVKPEVLDLGVWVEAQLERANRYAEAIWQLVNEGKLFWSSGAMPHLVQKAPGGELLRWPVCEWTLTPTPCNPLAFVKPAEAKAHFESVGLKYNEINEAGDESASDQVVEGAAAGLEAPGPEQTDTVKDGGLKEMGELDKDALYAEFKQRRADEEAAAAQAAQQEQERVDAIKAAAVAEYKREQAEKAAERGRFPFPLAEGPESGGEAEVPAPLKSYVVMSPYDRLGTLDLAMRFYLKSRAAQFGACQGPSERMYRALMLKASEFMNEEDEIVTLDFFGRATAHKVPAFDLRALVPWSDRDEEDTTFVPGVGFVKYSDNVTPNGVKSLMEIGLKADELVYSTQSGFGSDWVPTLMAAALWRTIRLESRVLPALDQFDMPSNPFDHPREATDPVFYNVAETTDKDQLVIGANQPISESKIGTAKVTFSAGKTGAITFWSEEMNEDAIIAVEPQYRDQFGIKVAHHIDYLLLNGDETTGDTTNISYRGATPADAKQPYLTLDGLRHEPLAITITDGRNAGGAVQLDDVRKTRVLMGTAGIYGADPAQCVIFCDVSTSYGFEMLDEVLTLDKFGPSAVILRGQLGSVMGIPIVKSEDYGLTDANGYINATGTSNTQGSFLIVNRRGVRVGWRRRPRIYVGQIPFSDAWYIMATARLDIGFFGAGMVGLTYNLTV